MKLSQHLLTLISEHFRETPDHNISLHSLQVKLIKMGGRIVGHARRIVFQLTEVAVPREAFAAILERVPRLRTASWLGIHAVRR